MPRTSLRAATLRAAPGSGHPERLARFETRTVPRDADIVEASVAEIHQLLARAGAARPVGKTLLHVAQCQQAGRTSGLGTLVEGAHGDLHRVTGYSRM